MAKQDIYVDYDFKQNQLQKAVLEKSSSAPTSPVSGQVYYNTGDNTFRGWNGTLWVDLSMVFSGGITIKSEITNANTSPAYPSTPSVGDWYFITTNAGTVGGQVVEIGDVLIYGSSGWFVVQRNLQQASASIAGYVQLANQTEVNTGSEATKAVTAQTLAGFLSNFLYSKKVVQNIASLAAGTPSTVTHGLGLVAQSDLHVQCWLSGAPVGLAIAATSVNAFTVTSNVALTNVNVVVIG